MSILSEIFKPDERNECAAGIKSKVCARGRVLEKMKQFANINCNDNECIEKMVSSIKNKLGVERELDIIKHPKFIKKVGHIGFEELDKIYKPRGPANTTDLLSNIEIESTLDQWQEASFNRAFKAGRFLHIPFEMRDFKRRYNSMLQNLDLFEVGKKYDCAACVLNTDVWRGVGKHWLCIFITFGDEVIIEYFNSSGSSPMYEVVEWKDEKLANLYKKGGTGYMKQILDYELQKSRTECGMFCLCYIKARLENIPPEKFIASFTDDAAIQGRKLMFNH